MKDFERIEELTLKILDGEASEAEIEELEDLVRADEKARQVHIALVEQEATLRGDKVNLELAAPVLERVREERSRRVEKGVMDKIRGTGRTDPESQVIRRIEPEWQWLGGFPFWGISALAAAVVIFIVGLQGWHLSSRHAGPQQAFLYGQHELVPGTSSAYRVLVRNSLTTQPVPAAHVQFAVLNLSDRTIWETGAVTDKEGIVEVMPDLPADLAEGDYRIKVTADSDGDESTISSEVKVRRTFRALVTTDKPLYQPGQTIHIRTLALAKADMKPIAGRDITIEVQDAKGNKVFKKQAKTSDFGIASADFQLADQVNDGDYTVKAAIGDTVSERSVTVKHYTLPKFKVSLSAEKAYYAPGDRVKCDLAADYTFGKPVAGAKVQIVASEFIETFRPFSNVDGTTNAEGHFSFEIPLKSYFVGQQLHKGDAFASLEATVIDTAGHTQKKTLELTVTSDPIRIEVFPESGTLVQHVPNIIYIVTVYPDGRPAKTRLTIGASRKVTETSDVGIAKVELTPERPDLRLTVQAEDKFGVRATVTRALRIDTRTDSVLLRTDKAVYRAGSSAELTLFAPGSTGRAFVDVIKDQRTVLMKGVDLENSKANIALDLPPDLFGTLELHAYRIMRDGNIVGDTKVIQVTRADDLAISASLDKEVYRPAEKAVLDLVVKRADGDPVQAALSLAGVDEAVFALQEMRPGLERVYFMLQEEILKPRYEIHAQVPLNVSQFLQPGSTEKPELEEASVVLFTSAEGEAAPRRDMSESFQEKKDRFREEEDNYFRNVRRAVVFLPVGLFFLLVLPIGVYAIARLFHREPIQGASEEQLEQLKRAGRNLTLWWALGLYLPIIVFLLGALGGGEGAYIPAQACCLVSLVMLVRWTHAYRKTPASHAAPVYRKLIACLPAAYFLGWIGVACLVVAAGLHPQVIAEETAITFAFIIAGVIALVVSALSVSNTSIVNTVSVGRWFILAFSRLALPGIALILIAAVLLTQLTANFARSRGALDGIMDEDAKRPMAMNAIKKDGAIELNRNPEWREKFAESRISAMTSASGLPVADKVELKAPTRIRNFFPETLFWKPELITDRQGRARYEIPLADSITTWRIGMSAVSGSGELGSATHGLRVFQDFFVDIDFPVALTQGDRVSVPIAVYSYLDVPQKVRLEVTPQDWFDLIDGRTHEMTIQPKEIKSASITLTALKPGQHSLLVKAFGSAMADAVERKVRVEPLGKPVVQTVNGRLEENITQKFTLPAEAVAGASDLIVKIYPGAFSQVMEGMDSIFQMPGGCFEQTSSSTYPNILVLDYMRRTNQIKPDVEMKALNFINTGYQRLLSYEVKGGGFEWFGQSPANIVLTAYGLMEFSDMAKVYDIDQKIITRTRNWLYSKQNSDGSWKPTEGGIAEGAINRYQGQILRTTAYVAWAMAESGGSDARLTKALDYIAGHVNDTTDTYTLAVSANALIAGKDSRTNDILKILNARKSEKEGLLSWTSSGESATFSRGDALDVETTALAVYAHLKAKFQTGDANKALEWLISKKDPRGTWYSTQATVLAMRALLEGTGGSFGSVEKDMHVTITANGKVAKEITITPDASDVFHLISLREFVKSGENQVALETAGKGSLAYQIVASHYMPWRDGDSFGHAKEMSIDIGYNTTELERNDTLKAHVTVQYNRPGTANMTIIDLGIPPGFEVLPDAFETLKRTGHIERYSLTGRQVILYLRELKGGEPFAFDYQMKAKFPVKVKTPLSQVYQYYEPTLRDATVPVNLNVL